MKYEPDNAKIFGKALTLWRLDKGLTIGELSKKSKLSRVTISKIENGHTLGGIRAWKKIGKALNLSYEEIRSKLKEVQ
jgi:transcriptional regulator with XRE-family HTH domain